MPVRDILFIQCWAQAAAGSGGGCSIALSAIQKGKAVEHLVAAGCILASDGALNVSTSFVDDEGVDLVFHRRGKSATLAVQVKSRGASTVTIKKSRFSADVGRSTFEPRDDLYILYTVIDEANAEFGPAWLVPSKALATKDRGKKNIRFSTNVRPTGRGQWDEYYVTRADLPSKILSILAELQKTGR